jgi:hypothetical protein
MTYLTAGMVVLTLATAFNLLMNQAMIRRMRGYERALDAGPDVGGPAVGTALPAFEARAEDEHLITPDALRGRRALIAFFATDCRGCGEAAPAFAERVKDLRDQGITSVAVVTTPADKPAADWSQVLGTADSVIVETKPGQLSTRLGMRVTPAYLLVDSAGRVLAKNVKLDDCLAGVR